MNSDRARTLPLAEGALAGILAWAIGYAITYIVVAPSIRESPANRIIDAIEGQPATYELVGWVFYNAHFVNTVFRNVPLVGSQTTSLIGGEQGFTLLLYAVPAVVLLVMGFALARYRSATDATGGMLAGSTVLPGYLLLSIAGVFLFEVTLGAVRGGPDLVPAVFLAGLVAPLLFGGAGGALGGLLGRKFDKARAAETMTS